MIGYCLATSLWARFLRGLRIWLDPSGSLMLHCPINPDADFNKAEDRLHPKKQVMRWSKRSFDHPKSYFTISYTWPSWLN